jgi:hypothetical protein
MLLQVQGYDLDVNYVSGKEILVADTLSRNFVTDTFPDLSKGMEAQIHSFMTNLPRSDRKLQEIKNESDCDEQFQLLRDVILQGWPENRRDPPFNPRILESQ